MKKVKIAQIGVNSLSHAVQIFASLAKQSDLFEIAGYTLVENEREKFADKLSVFDGYKELTLDEILNDPTITAVTVETEEIHLTKYALLAAKAGKHIHMEKPGGCDPDEFAALIDIMKQTGKVFHTGYMYRYNPYVQDLMTQVKQGELGEIISVEAQMNCRHTPENRQWLRNFPGGMMFFLGCHLVDLILQIQGKPDAVIPMNKCTGIDGVTSEDFGFALFVYKNGVSFAKTNAEEIGGFARRQLVVTGSKKTVELKPLEMPFLYGEAGQYTERTEYVVEAPWTNRGETTQSPAHDRYAPMMAAFARMAAGEIENPWTYDYELYLYQTLLKACGKEN